MIELKDTRIETLGDLKAFISNLPTAITDDEKITSVHNEVLFFQYTSIENFIVSLVEYKENA